MKRINKLVLAALFLAVGIVLPFLTMQLKSLGNMLLPMHLPVFLCSYICGYKYALTVGFVLPVLRSAIFSMPVMYPGAVSMAFELAVYGLVAGLIYSRTRSKGWGSVYFSLVSAMVAGRIVWAIVQLILLGAERFTLGVFMSGAVISALPGIIIQLILIPVVVMSLKKARYI